MSAAKRWYYASMGTQHGPVSDCELKELADRNQLQPDDLVVRMGMKEWKPARAVKGLFPANQSHENSIPSPDRNGVASSKKESPSLASRTGKASVQNPRRKIADRWRKIGRRGKLILVGGGGLLAVLLVLVPLSLRKGRPESGGKAETGPIERGDSSRLTPHEDEDEDFDRGNTGGEDFSSRTLDVREIERENRRDSKATFRKYGGKRLKVRAIVDHVEINDDDADIFFDGEAWGEFDKSYARRYRKGDEIIFEGTLHTKTAGVTVFDNCRPLDANKSGPKSVGPALKTLSHALVASKIRSGMSPALVRDILGKPDDEKRLNINSVISNGKVVSPAIDHLTFVYNSTLDGAIVILFKDGKAWGAESPKGRIFGGL